ncbi:MAG TPA: S46 family peptidase, partial [Planctomycetota bacterium]|nr:S46 family peptidase [Planctomycetota bacterium]
ALIEKEFKDSTGQDCEIVTLYQGGEYWLYAYKKFTDVRVVFAPEFQAAFYGGDPDNFTYPRYCLDMTLFRVYENGEPYRPSHWLSWNASGAEAGELVFVSGHPGSTERLSTLAQLETARDASLPMQLASLARRHAALKRYAARGDEQARQAADQIFGIENSLKALTGRHQGLLDESLMAKKAAEEADFRKRVAANPEWAAAYGSAWDEIAAAQQALRGRAAQGVFWSVGRSGSRLASKAVHIVQYVAEVGKPDGERLPGYHDAELESTRFSLFSPAPIYPEFETALLADWLAYQQESLPKDDPFVAACLDGKTPEEAARALVAGSRVQDADFRKSLVEGGATAVAQSDDPLIAMARRVDPLLRELVKWREAEVDSKVTAAGQRIGAARFAVYGKTVSPDATFTLRLSFGAVEGYDYNGTVAPPKTTLYGLFDRAASFGDQPPYDLAPLWKAAADELDLSTPLDFVCTTDIIGGNSGSPVVNRAGQIVGLVFDGNIESLVGNYVYDETRNRTVAVHTAGMTEALLEVYGAESLVEELLGGGGGG